MAKLLSYIKLDSILSKLGAQLNAAEMHGLLTGMLSIDRVAKTESWRKALLENLDCVTPTKTQWSVLDAATAQITQAFNEQNFSFNLVLPPDSLPLEERVDALGCWCRGYLSGLGLVGITQEDLDNPTVKELVADLSHIAHVSIEQEAGKEAENDYMELVEYVRIAVQDIQVELKGVEHSKMIH